MRRRIKGQRVYDTSQEPNFLKRGLVGHWVGGGSGKTWIDKSGYGNGGDFLGEPEWSLGQGGNRAGILLDGVNDNIIVGTNLVDFDHNGNFSVSVWFKPDTIGAEHALVAENAITSSQKWGLRVGTTGFLRYASYNGTTFVIRTATDNALVAGEWCHVVLTRTDVRLHGYVNGVEVTWDNNGTVDGGTGSPALRFGFYRSIFWADGILDDIRIYDRELSQAEAYWLSKNSDNYVTPMKPRRYRLDITPPTLTGVGSVTGFNTITF